MKINKNKYIINHLAKTKSENSKVLDWYSTAIMSKILDIITANYGGKRNQESKDLRQIRFIHQSSNDVVSLALDDVVQHNDNDKS